MENATNNVHTNGNKTICFIRWNLNTSWTFIKEQAYKYLIRSSLGPVCSDWDSSPTDSGIHQVLATYDNTCTNTVLMTGGKDARLAMMMYNIENEKVAITEKYRSKPSLRQSRNMSL